MLFLRSAAATGSERRRCGIAEVRAAELNKTACHSLDRVEDVDAAAVTQSRLRRSSNNVRRKAARWVGRRGIGDMSNKLT